MQNINSKNYLRSRNKAGYTLVELLITISIIALLFRIILPVLGDAKSVAYYTRAQQEFDSIHQSMLHYFDEHGDFPADANRDIPPGLEAYLAPGIWPDAPWPGSVYDWDRFTDVDTGEEVLQISARFCPIGQPSECQFPENDWAESFDINSSVYYCIEGPCRAHPGRPLSHPGYCINCP